MKFFVLIYGVMADLIIRYLPNFKKNEYCFAFLAHPRNLKDATHKFPFLKILMEPCFFKCMCYHTRNRQKQIMKLKNNKIFAVNFGIEPRNGLISLILKKI